MKISMRVLLVFSGLIFFYFVLVFASEQYLQRATYSSERDFTDSIRLKYLRQQIDIMNKGGYFQISPAVSLIQQRAALDDVGIHVGLADLAFFQKIIHSQYRFTLLDYFYLQYIMLGIAVVLMVLPVVPFRISIAALLSLFLAQLTGKIEWEAHLYWPAPVSVILASVLLFSIFYRCRQSPIRWRDVSQMLGIAIFIGVLGLCRGDAKVIGLIPCLTLIGVVSIAIGTMCYSKEMRILFLSSFRSVSTRAARIAVIWRIYAIRLIIVTFSILFLSSLIVRVSFFLNLSFFERIEKQTSLPQNTKGHLFWEPLLIGIGATYNTSRAMQNWNHENVIWGDENAFGRAWTIDPDNPLFQRSTSDYGPLASAMRTLYLDLLSQNPLDVFSSYYLKTAALLKHSGIWLLVSLGVFLYLMLQAAYNPLTFFSAFVVQLSFLSLFAVTMAPAILITAYSNGSMLSSSEPLFLSYINSYWTILLAYPIFMVSFQSLLPSFSQFSDLFCLEKGRYKTLANGILLSLTVVFFCGFLSIAAWFGYKQQNVVRLRNNLTESRESSVTFLKNAYHADIVRAINGLPEKERNEVLEFIGKAEWGIPISLSVSPNTSSDLIVKGAKWVGDNLFLIVHTRTQLKGAKIVPLNVHDTAKGGNAIVLLPQNLKAGNWLFSVMVGSKSNRVTVYEPVPYLGFQYLQPPASSPLVSIINLSLSD
ncbi:MAG TPA: hypothetical protein PLA90_02600 [Candidatus Sumerlaeota bacterium]|nr:hypothetical protein [Candidatus Sumerlaeota bacterium]HPS00410.1 hypothetical protein [Candidatus Sumerlaeota bacterium]